MSGAWRKGLNTKLLFVTNTMHQFGHFSYTDFHETRQEYVDPSAGELQNYEFLPLRVSFPPKQILGHHF